MKKVLVTGGTGHIGKAIVKRFLDKGFFVYIHGSKMSSLEDFARELEMYSGSFEIVAYDVKRISDEVVIDQIYFDSIDILVNAIGGGGAHESWGSTSISKWLDVYYLNVIAPVYFIKKIIGSMRLKSFGRVVNIASISASKTLNIGPEYSSAKAAIVNLSKSLAQEFKNTAVTVNCVSPGLVYTDLVKRMMCKAYNIRMDADDVVINKAISENFYPNLAKGLPTVDEIARLVEYLCSEDARHITGQDVVIDSGYSLCNFVENSVE